MGFRNPVPRVVVVGAPGSGKSSLIKMASDRVFETVPPSSALPPTRLTISRVDNGGPPGGLMAPITVVDTCLQTDESIEQLIRELQIADAVLITFAYDKPLLFDQLRSFWLPGLHALKVNAPVIVVGCKLDLYDHTQVMSLKKVVLPLMTEFHEIDICIDCSARNLNMYDQIRNIFFHAWRVAAAPAAPLFNKETVCLRARCVRAFTHIFIICDQDRDGLLSDAELCNLELKCWGETTTHADLQDYKRLAQEEEVNERGVTLAGFLSLQSNLVKLGSTSNLWGVLYHFGFDSDLKLRDDLLPVLSKGESDQSYELTRESVEFLKAAFSLFDLDKDGTLQRDELDHLFSYAPESPWDEAPYKNVGESTALGGLSLDVFLSKWDLMTLMEPSKTLAYLFYIGYPQDISSPFCMAKRKWLDCKREGLQRNFLQCFVFGPKNAGKSELLNAFLGRPFLGSCSSTSKERFAVNFLDCFLGTKKTLVLREISEDEVRHLMSEKESLAACDVAIFVHDSSEKSWNKVTDLLLEVASHAKDCGSEMPCLIVTAKDDLDPYGTALKKFRWASQQMGLQAPIPVSTKLGDLNDLFHKIVNTAEQPHLSIPVTEAWEISKVENLKDGIDNRITHAVEHSHLIIHPTEASNFFKLGGLKNGLWKIMSRIPEAKVWRDPRHYLVKKNSGSSLSCGSAMIGVVTAQITKPMFNLDGANEADIQIMIGEPQSYDKQVALEAVGMMMYFIFEKATLGEIHAFRAKVGRLDPLREGFRSNVPTLEEILFIKPDMMMDVRCEKFFEIMESFRNRFVHKCIYCCPRMIGAKTAKRAKMAKRAKIAKRAKKAKRISNASQ
ncbi:hypothetical protein GIB67_006731 [Kingdonia uniflora]|uniref:EF-hand domain-containing protein n=1 Tax=Kingdonia uniflora TaxID=39325 RepID=A0A7J7LZ12_9MAGN|nr:hypothetical protein GIB67_006731 [Kingdonia uniflora]